MLKKEVCRLCHTINTETDEFFQLGWTSEDDIDWKNNYVYCPCERIGLTFTNEEPPEKCPYRLEHTVLGDK